MADFSNDKKKPLLCQICDTCFYSIEKLKAHLPICASEAAKTPYKCDLCDKECLSQTGLKNHKRTHGQLYKCRWCTKRFCYAKSKQNHELKDHREEYEFEESFLDEPEEDEEKIIDEIDLRLETTPRRKLRPKTRRNPIAKLQKVKDQGNVKIKEKLYRCRCCNELFANKRDFRAHVHQTSPKLYECDLCTKMFGDENNLMRHKEVHELKESLVFRACAFGYFAVITSAFSYFGLFF